MADELSIVFTGVPGCGKSTACQFFVMGNHEPDKKFLSISKQSACIKTIINTRSVKLVDTPGFCDANISMLQRNEEMSHALLLAKAGVHAFVFVLDATSRFSQTHLIALQDFQKLENITPFTFVLFTKAKQLGSSEAEQQHVISEMLDDSNCPIVLKQFMENIDYRYIMLESVDYMTEDYYISKCRELIDKVDAIFMKNRMMFTCSLMNLAKQVYDAQEEIHKQSNQTLDEMAIHAAAAYQLQGKLAEIEQMYTERVTESSTQSEEIQTRTTTMKGVTICTFSLVGAAIGSCIWPMVGTITGAMVGLFVGKQIYNYTEKTQD